jgi:hypothetical protein
MEELKVITFGKFNEKMIEWYVLSENSEYLNLISKNGLISLDYSLINDNTWRDSQIRHYLNSEFFNSFTKEERSRIVLSHIDTYGERTRDYFYIPSYDEMHVIPKEAHFTNEPCGGSMHACSYLRGSSIKSFRGRIDYVFGGNLEGEFCTIQKSSYRSPWCDEIIRCIWGTRECHPMTKVMCKIKKEV